VKAGGQFSGGWKGGGSHYGGHWHGGKRWGGAGWGFYGYPSFGYAYSEPDYYSECYRNLRVRTRHGLRWRRVWVCD
jgi:hypothetical protein